MIVKTILKFKELAVNKFFQLIIFNFFISNLYCQHITLNFRSISDTKDYFHYSDDGFFMIIGHRGGTSKGFPENSLHTFNNTFNSVKEYPLMFETDPRLTKDSIVVLLHDAELNRVTTGKGKIKDFNFKEIEDLKLKDLDGNISPFRLSTFGELLKWAKGKTIVNIDVKDVPVKARVDSVRKYDAFSHVMFTVHNYREANEFYSYDERCLFTAYVLDEDALNEYEQTEIPWSNFLMAYVGSEVNEKTLKLRDLLHKKGVMVSIGLPPTYDRYSDWRDMRNEAYKRAVENGFDVLATDRPIQFYQAVKDLLPKKSKKYKYWKTVK